MTWESLPHDCLANVDGYQAVANAVWRCETCGSRWLVTNVEYLPCSFAEEHRRPRNPTFHLLSGSAVPVGT